MKNRKLWNNIFTVIILASLAFFLLAYFGVFRNESLEGWISKITLPVAMLSALFMEIILPYIDNKELFRTDSKMRLKLIIKIILFVLALIPLGLNISGVLEQSNQAEFGVLAAFVVLYMAQFFINLDPKPAPTDDTDDNDSEEGSDDDGEEE